MFFLLRHYRSCFTTVIIFCCLHTTLKVACGQSSSIFGTNQCDVVMQSSHDVNQDGHHMTHCVHDGSHDVTNQCDAINTFIGDSCPNYSPEDFGEVRENVPTKEDDALNSIRYTPVKLGVEVRGVDLKSNFSNVVLQKIRRDIHTHRLLIFKDQGVVSGLRHVEISKMFGTGEMDSEHRPHNKAPHPDVFRVSNDAKEGHTGIGRKGWHIDGSFQQKPSDYAFYHMVAVPSDGATAFVGLTDVVESMSAETRSLLERLWRVDHRNLYKGQQDESTVHPIIYAHHVTGKKVMAFHLGFTDDFIWDYGSEHEQLVSSAKEISRLKTLIRTEIEKNNRELVYKHQWQPGDFIISDNRAVAHEAAPESQLPVSKVGLRVLHRVLVKGSSRPSK